MNITTEGTTDAAADIFKHTYVDIIDGGEPETAKDTTGQTTPNITAK